MQKTGLQDIVRIALAGLGTGALSYAVMMYWPTALQIPFPISLGKYGGAGVSSLPGLFFGALVAFCNWKFGIRDKLHLGVIVAFTLISWVLAVNVTQFTFDYITKYTKSPPAAFQPGRYGDRKCARRRHRRRQRWRCRSRRSSASTPARG